MSDQGMPEAPKTGRWTAAIKAAVVAWVKRTGRVHDAIKKYGLSMEELAEWMDRSETEDGLKVSKKRKKR